MPSLGEWYWRFMSYVSADGRHRAARWFMKHGRFDEAADLLHTLRDRQPLKLGMLPDQFAQVLLDLGVCRFEQGRHDDAADAWRRVLKVARLTPITPDALYNLGSVELQNGRPDAARATFDEAIGAAREAFGLTSPQAVRVQAMVADRFVSAGAYDVALSYARAALETAVAARDPDPASHGDALEALARAAQGCERFGEARQLWAEVATRGATAALPDPVAVARALLGRAAAEYADGRPDESAQTLRSASEWLGRARGGGEGEPEIEFCVANLEGVMALDARRHRDARAIFERSLGLAERLPHDVALRDQHVIAVRGNLAQALAELGGEPAAADALLASAREDRSTPWAAAISSAAAAVCVARGDWAGAESNYRDAIAGRDAKYDRAALACDHLALGDLYARTGRLADARGAYDLAAELGADVWRADHPKLADVRAKLARLVAPDTGTSPNP